MNTYVIMNKPLVHKKPSTFHKSEEQLRDPEKRDIDSEISIYMYVSLTTCAYYWS